MGYPTNCRRCGVEWDTTHIALNRIYVCPSDCGLQMECLTSLVVDEEDFELTLHLKDYRVCWFDEFEDAPAFCVVFRKVAVANASSSFASHTFQSIDDIEYVPYTISNDELRMYEVFI